MATSLAIRSQLKSGDHMITTICDPGGARLCPAWVFMPSLGKPQAN